MYHISDKQIDFILDDIRRRGIEMEDLQLNLLDHVCCIIEQNLSHDGDFEDFYKQTIPKFCKSELWEIEEETILLLTYKNYYTMKKAMILGGNISLALIALGTALKIFHWPGASISLLLGFIILCFVFFPAALYLNYNSAKKGLGINLSAFTGGTSLILGVLFKVMHWPGASILLIVGWTILLALFIPLLLISKLKENIPAKEKRIYTLGAFALILFELATLFKIMHWPGAGPLLIVGSFLLVGGFIPLYTNMKVKANAMSPGQFVFVITLSMYAIVLTSLLAMNVSKHVFERILCDEADDSKIIHYFEKKKERLLSQLTNDSTQLVQFENKKHVVESSAEIKNLIRDIRIDLVEHVEGVDKIRAQELLLKPVTMLQIDNQDWVNELLLVNQQKQYATKLKLAINNFKSAILKASTNNEFTSKVNALLNTDNEITPDYNISWEESNFRNNSLISVLARLNNIEKNIYVLEMDILTSKN